MKLTTVISFGYRERKKAAITNHLHISTNNNK